MKNDLRKYKYSDYENLGIWELKLVAFYFRDAFKKGYDKRHPVLNQIYQEDYKNLLHKIRLKEIEQDTTPQFMEKIFLEHIKEFFPECYNLYIKNPQKTEWLQPLRNYIIPKWITS